MKLRKYLEEKTSEWVGYQRPAVDWMTTEKEMDYIYFDYCLCEE